MWNYQFCFHENESIFHWTIYYLGMRGSHETDYFGSASLSSWHAFSTNLRHQRFMLWRSHGILFSLYQCLASIMYRSACLAEVLPFHRTSRCGAYTSVSDGLPAWGCLVLEFYWGSWRLKMSCWNLCCHERDTCLQTKGWKLVRLPDPPCVDCPSIIPLWHYT